MEFGHKIKNLWWLDDDVVFLNHGSFGLTPKKVLEAANEWSVRLEREPVKFFIDEYFHLIREAADNLAAFLDTKGENIVFVENATSGVNSVLRSLLPEFSHDDEIIVTSHVYPAVRNTLNYISSVTKAKVIEVDVPFPFENKEELIEPFRYALTDKTKLAIIDHIAYTTGVILPVKEITAMLKEKNILTLIDGAHVPGQIDLDIEELHCDWYVGNCHKWLFAPKGCALLWSSPDVQKFTKPLSLSLFYGEGYNIEFDWTGTRNPSSWLSITAAIEFYNTLGKDNIKHYIHSLAVDARRMLASRLSLQLPAPDNMFGSLAALEMPGKYNGTKEETHQMRNLLLKEYNIEIPFINYNDKLWFRISAQVYNEMQDYDKLADAIEDIYHKG